jgi:hypothetical protein
MLLIVLRDRCTAMTIPRRSPLTKETPAGFHRNVGPCAQGDADLGLRECGGVVNAVAGHGNETAFALEALDLSGH